MKYKEGEVSGAFYIISFQTKKVNIVFTTTIQDPAQEDPVDKHVMELLQSIEYK
jgi:hypothetical protein